MSKLRPLALFSTIVLVVAALAFVGLVLLRPTSQPAAGNSTPAHTPTQTLTEEPVIRFGDEIELLDVDVVQGNTGWIFTLTWKAVSQPKADYSLFIQAALGKEVMAQTDEMLQGRLQASPGTEEAVFPTSAWRVNTQVIQSTHTLNLTGEFAHDTVYIGLYDAQIGARLPVSQGGTRFEQDRVMIWSKVDEVSLSTGTPTPTLAVALTEAEQTSTPAVPAVDREREALIALYRATDGTHWTRQDNWLQDNQPICSWYGVTCADDHVETLDLSKNNLQGKLPTEIGQITGLQKLLLSGNSITEIPPEVGQLTRLQQLELQFNQIAELPPQIGQLTSLETLNLGSNQLAGLPSEIGQLTNLKSLYLFSNQLTEVPLGICQLAHLQNLDLQSNPLTRLPPEIGQLSDLKGLMLFYDKLTELPPEIGQLTNLEYLHLGNNQLTALPSEIGQLIHLQKLFLDGNPLTSVPPEVCQLPALQIMTPGGLCNP